MNDYLFGSDVLGADLTPVQQMQAQQQMMQAMNMQATSPMPSPFSNQQAQIKAQEKAARVVVVNRVRNIMLIMIGSSLIGGTGGALLRTAHRPS